ncbi:hypothetical protein Tco_0958550 [Tanacetum coccineum]
MGTSSTDVILVGTEGAVQQGPVRARVLNDLSAEEKERYKADIRATNILLQGKDCKDKSEQKQSKTDKKRKRQVQVKTREKKYQSRISPIQEKKFNEA